MLRRRVVLASLLAGCSLAGCTGGPNDGVVTMLAVNEHDVSHAVAVRVTRDGDSVVSGEADVGAGGHDTLAEFAWAPGRYRVRARVDGESVLDRTFRGDERFNVLDVIVTSDGSVELNRGTAA